MPTTLLALSSSSTNPFTRSDTEILIFIFLQIALILARCAALVQFLWNIYGYIRLTLKNKQALDRYIIWGIFVCQGIAFVCFIVYRAVEVSIKFSIIVTANSEQEKIIRWREKHENEIDIVDAVFIHMGYCLQNMALVINIFSYMRHRMRLFKISLIIVIISALFLMFIDIT